MKTSALKARCSGLAAVAVIVLVGGVSLLACEEMVRDAFREWRADDEFRAHLLAEAKRSEAHRFLVSNWLQCNGLNSTRASCFAAIRVAASSRGEAFVQQIDRAAQDLKLI